MAKTSSGTVAVVDDDPAVLDSLKFLLELAGHRVLIYGSAAEFLQSHAAQPSCLILDHHMPQMTGLELVARLRKDGTSIPILLITGSLSQAIVARAADLGIEKVLEKPLNDDDLMSFVEACY
jgi:two-component system, LuxR family, response regulator FixJ